MVNKNKEEIKIPSKSVTIKSHLGNELNQIRSIFKPPFLKNTLLACITAFTVTSSFYALYLWLPEIFQRFANFQAEHTGENSNFCSISKDTFSTITSKKIVSTLKIIKLIENNFY